MYADIGNAFVRKESTQSTRATSGKRWTSGHRRGSQETSCWRGGPGTCAINLDRQRGVGKRSPRTAHIQLRTSRRFSEYRTAHEQQKKKNLWTKIRIKKGEMSEVKRKDLARPYKAPPALSPEHLPPDYMALISLIFGLLGMIAKVGFQLLPAHRDLHAVTSLTWTGEDRLLARRLCLHFFLGQRQEI